MTKADVEHYLKDVKLKFSSYYKYTFSFRATWFDCTVSASIGGDADDIYRESVDADEERPLLPLSNWRGLTIRRGDEVVYEEYA